MDDLTFIRDVAQLRRAAPEAVTFAVFQELRDRLPPSAPEWDRATRRRA